MEEKNTSKSDSPELLELFHNYEDGRFGRRSFLNRAGLAVGSIGAARLLGGLVPSARAQQVPNAAERVPNAASKLPPDRFDYLPITDRPVIKWPNNARVAFWVGPNIEWTEYTPLNRPTQPDIASYSYREYGNRIGFWRMLEVLDKHSIRCSVCLHVAMLEHYPEIRDAMIARNWDYMAHEPVTAYSIDEERAYWTDIIAKVKKYTGKQIKGRLGAGGGSTVNTPDLMAELGLIYHTDWMMDDQPVPLKVKNGAKFIHVPYSYQLNDLALIDKHHDAAYLCQMIKDQFDVLYEEGAQSGKVMCVALHPFLIGRANRAKYLDEALRYIKSHNAVWYTTADDIAEYYMKNYYDQVVTYIEQQKQKGLA